MRVELEGGKAIEAAQGDITRETTEAIVNAANSSLLGGGGVDGAIHRAGGPEILEACRKVRLEQYPDGLPTGTAVATTAGKLRARHVIHTVGPVWGGGEQGEAESLASCYREALRVADGLRLKSVSFPAISTGVYGYPVLEAAKVAVETVRVTLPSLEHTELVRLIAFDAATARMYEEELGRG